MNDIKIGGLQEKYINSLRENKFSDEDIEKTMEAAKQLVEKFSKDGDDAGLLFGRVQSGKTNSMIMSMARANDQGFTFFIVLTSDNVSLYEQTLKRVKSGLQTLFILGIEELKDPKNIMGRVRIALKYNGLVIVTKKNQINLKSIEKFLTVLDVSGSTAIVMDDEADFGSLNSKVNRDEQSRIHELIIALRKKFKVANFVQVTATPQPIFLQSYKSEFRPKFVVTIPTASGYIGGEDLFNRESDNVKKNIQRVITENEIEGIIEHTDYSSFGLTAIPEGIRRAISVFMVGSVCKKITGSKATQNSMLCHISSKQDAHRSLNSLVNRYVQIVSENLSDTNGEYRQGIDQDLVSAYEDIGQTFKGTMPNFEMVRSEIYANVFSTNVQIIIGGKERKNPTYDALFNILIGGERLGRGLTIPNLTVTYYGRATNAPKVDTILQHSRMYGYRKNLLDVMRFYSTENLFEIYHDVFTSDNEEWEYFSSSTHSGNMPVILSLARTSKLRPTRKEVIPIENILKYFPGKAYIMYKAKDENTGEIDKALEEFQDMRTYPVDTTFDKLMQLLPLFKNEGSEQRWNADAISEAIKNIELNNKSANEKDKIKPRIVVRRDRNITKDYRSVLSSDDNTIREDKSLMLFAYRLNGKHEDNWSGKPVWVPVIRFPVGNAYYYTTTYSVPEGGEEEGEN